MPYDKKAFHLRNAIHLSWLVIFIRNERLWRILQEVMFLSLLEWVSNSLCHIFCLTPTKTHWEVLPWDTVRLWTKAGQAIKDRPHMVSRALSQRPIIPSFYTQEYLHNYSSKHCFQFSEATHTLIIKYFIIVKKTC